MHFSPWCSSKHYQKRQIKIFHNCVNISYKMCWRNAVHNFSLWLYYFLHPPQIDSHEQRCFLGCPVSVLGIKSHINWLIYLFIWFLCHLKLLHFSKWSHQQHCSKCWLLTIVFLLMDHVCYGCFYFGVY